MTSRLISTFALYSHPEDTSEGSAKLFARSLRGGNNLFQDSRLYRRSNLMNMGKYAGIATAISFWTIIITEAPRKGFEFLIQEAK